MRGKDYNAGLRGVLFEARHYERMGAAIWLYGWLVLRQTRQQGTIGWVLGGAPVQYREIEEETGFNPRTLERWMQTLRRHGYIETEAIAGGVCVRIMKAKKYPQGPQGVRRNAGGGREFAEGRPQNCGASRGDPQRDQQFADGIGSSSIEGFQEEAKTREIHKDFHNPANQTHGRTQNQNLSCLGSDKNKRQDLHSKNRSQRRPDQRPRFEANNQNQNQPYDSRQFMAEARIRLALLRAEREEAVRRELNVGGGPEVIRR
jgi:hypothetical protein